MKKTCLVVISCVIASLGFSCLAEDIRVTLKLKSRVSMEELAESVSNPSSPRFGQFYDPSEIRALAAPRDTDYEDLLRGLKLEGLEVVQESPTHLWLTVHGSHKVFESLFATEIAPTDQGTHRMMRPLSIPFHLNLIQSVSGLDSTRKSHPKYKATPRYSDDTGYSPKEIQDAYGFSALYKTGLSGKNVNIAIATYDSFKMTNVQKFFSLHHISPKPVYNQVNIDGKAKYVEQSAGETELDAEFSGMIAPGSHIHVYTAAENSDQAETALFTKILDDNQSKLVNYSWGGCETFLDPAHKTEMQAVFARAVAQGVNIFVASGDDGSDDCKDGTAATDWPSSSPFVTAVGGTTLSYNGHTRTEKGWSGSGGGISSLWALPTWQKGLPARFARRSSPDVAFNADPASGEAEYSTTSGYTGWLEVGGTSMAAPQWIGFMALVAEARARVGRAPLGYVTPVFYAMSAAERALTFNDVTTGSNGAYKCAVGWDAVTGFGSMQADALAAYLGNL